MKKKLYIVTVLLAIVFVAMTSCDDYASYAEQRDYELSALSRFINNPSFGEIKGKKINVISEEEFLKDTITDFLVLGSIILMVTLCSCGMMMCIMVNSFMRNLKCVGLLVHLTECFVL